MNLADLLREKGWEPPDNICSSCGHSGGDHDLGNWCLLCPRPAVEFTPVDLGLGARLRLRLAAGWCYFTSQTEQERWSSAVAKLEAAGVHVSDDDVREAALAVQKYSREPLRTERPDLYWSALDWLDSVLPKVET